MPVVKLSCRTLPLCDMVRLFVAHPRLLRTVICCCEDEESCIRMKLLSSEPEYGASAYSATYAYEAIGREGFGYMDGHKL